MTVFLSRVLRIALGLVFLSAGAASAHRVGESYIMLESHPEGIEGRVEATLQDLSSQLGLDIDLDGKVSDAEFVGGRLLIEDYLQGRIALTVDGVPAGLEFGESWVMETDLGRYAVLPFHSSVVLQRELAIDYTGFFDALPEHRGFFILEYEHLSGTRNATEAVSLVFSPESTHQVLDLANASRWDSFRVFVGQGMHHIFIGLDHILFLVVLILPSVMRRREGQWTVVEGFRPAFFHVMKVVTLFTLAHSITLSLAALGVVNLGSRLVESVIAASVVVAAIYGGFLGKHIWPMVFLFGLFHGFGFAGVLGHIAMDRRFLLPSLVGFNVGVEIGQLVILGASFPLLWFLRRQSFYRPVVLHGASAAIGLLAFVWLIERVFDVTLLGMF